MMVSSCSLRWPDNLEDGAGDRTVTRRSVTSVGSRPSEEVTVANDRIVGIDLVANPPSVRRLDTDA